MAEEQTRQEEGDLVSTVHIWTSIKTGKAIRAIPKLDKETALLFSTDANKVLAFDGEYELVGDKGVAFVDKESKEPVIYRMFYRVR